MLGDAGTGALAKTSGAKGVHVFVPIDDHAPMEDAAAPVRVSFYPGACEDGSPSLPTTGTIKVTFSNMP